MQDLTQVSGRVKIQRFGHILTAWDIVHHLPGRIRLRHQAIYRDTSLANRLRGVIENLAGVLEFAVWPVTGSVLIRFDPDLITSAYLLQVLDHVKYTPRADTLHPETTRFWASQLLLGTGNRWRDHGPVVTACICYLVGRLECPHVPRCWTATRSRSIWATGTVYKHRGDNTRQWTIRRIGSYELDAHVLVTPIL